MSNYNLEMYPNRLREKSDSESEEKVSDVKTSKQNLNKTETKAVSELNYNTKVFTKLSITYMLESFEKNLLIIFNQYDIFGYKEKREGTMEDADFLIKTFGQYGFQCERHDEYTRKEILDKLDKYSKKDFTDYGCVVVSVMTHGTYDGGIMAKDLEYNELDILRRLNNQNIPSLKAKPLIVLLSACRGRDDTEGVAVNGPSVPKKKIEAATNHYYLPLEADTLVFHSSYIGKPSYRPANGTWFIQTLCEKINEMSDKNDLLTIMTEVKKEVACNRESIVKKSKDELEEHHKQMPTVTSALTKKLYLIRKSGNTTTHLVPSGVSRDGISSDAVINSVPTPSVTYSFYSKKQSSDSCLCHLDHLDYMENCLSQFTEDNPNDMFAQYLLKSMPQQREPNTELARMRLEIISNYLLNQSVHSDYRKYLYYYGAAGSDGDIRCNDNRLDRNSKLIEYTETQNFKMYMLGVVLGISTYIVVNRVVHNYWYTM